MPQLKSLTTLPQTREELLQLDNRAVKCPVCSCEFFQEVRVNRYDKDSSSLIGQEVPRVETTNFVLLQCIKCKEYLEPNITGQRQDLLGKLYQQFVNQLEEE